MSNESSNQFLLWMESLDAKKVAANESFHSQNHRDWVALHEFEKTRMAMSSSRVESFERQLTRIADKWDFRDRRESKKSETLRERVVANSHPAFTQKQIEIAIEALKKKEK